MKTTSMKRWVTWVCCAGFLLCGVSLAQDEAAPTAKDRMNEIRKQQHELKKRQKKTARKKQIRRNK